MVLITYMLLSHTLVVINAALQAYLSFIKGVCVNLKKTF